ncbi:conserved protein of unknown function [Methylacidimicrobium sp. AP8]|uniref:menaquinone biosynthesis decarboxylase n=1 Tax=Methylacidimicrobium sp. AP8 TaxID=2730359 RepID=UPI0018C16F2E|nr:menaquinone biosynthesis decarboxylase [Methylacidimicrobium sp. AP8]CAB4244257.1 conserved protein of unknown function [Methylacidimicrobium sp. AP8]
MACESSAEFVRLLEKEGELVRIAEPVKTDLEITALADREMKSPGGGYALLVEKPVLPDGSVSPFPVLINAFGSERRMALVLGRPVEEIVGEIRALLQVEPPRSFREGWQLLQKGLALAQSRPVRVENGPCRERVVRMGPSAEIDLLRLPVLRSWPKDGGPFITLPQVFTRDPETGKRNVGMYRMQVFDGTTTGMHWQIHKVGARHGKGYWARGERMPVAVCLGGDPILTFAATAPLPDGVDELLFAGFLRRKGIPLVRCETVDLEVPATADFVLEGYVQPPELRPEGPFGDHTGFYTPVDSYPVFHLTCLSHRKDAIYPATIVGKPPMEDFYLGTASVRLLFPVLQATFPEIVDLALPPEGVFHNLAFVSIRKQYPYQAYKVMHGLWGMGQMMFTKILVVVDAEVNVHDTSDVLFHLCANVDPERDFLFTRGPCDSLDHAQATPNVGSHVGIDATRKLPAEGYPRPWPEEAALPEDLRREIYARFPRKERAARP